MVVAAPAPPITNPKPLKGSFRARRLCKVVPPHLKGRHFVGISLYRFTLSEKHIHTSSSPLAGATKSFPWLDVMRGEVWEGGRGSANRHPILISCRKASYLDMRPQFILSTLAVCGCGNNTVLLCMHMRCKSLSGRGANQDTCRYPVFIYIVRPPTSYFFSFFLVAPVAIFLVPITRSM